VVSSDGQGDSDCGAPDEGEVEEKVVEYGLRFGRQEDPLVLSSKYGDVGERVPAGAPDGLDAFGVRAPAT
jgi:hypothetical protein